MEYVPILAVIINQQIIIIKIIRNLSIVERTIKFPPLGKTNIICYVCGRRGHRAFECKNWRQREFCHDTRTYSRGQTYFFALGYDIVLDKSNLLANCSLTQHVINLFILTKILNQGTILLNKLTRAEQII